MLKAKLAAQGLRGAGDAVALVAKPIARAVDAIAGTDLTNCPPCVGPGGRQERLNDAFPFEPPREGS